MPDIHYITPKLAQIYDLDSGWSSDRDFYLSLAEDKKMKILDLGCGTGLLCHAYAARGHQVTGVDPAKPMLDVGRKKPSGDRIAWVESTAQTFKPDRLYDLIIMTGHAFQVLLDERDILDVFKTVRLSLEPGGLFVFESRNPGINWEDRWNYDIEIQSPYGPVKESRRFISYQDEKMRFDIHYEFSDENIVSHSTLRFLSRSGIENLIASSGLCVETLYGDWNKGPFNESSEEMIFVVRR